MTIRPKTKRRVLILLTGLAIIIGGAFWLYSYRMGLVEGRLQTDKQIGMDAYRAGDFQTAIDRLARYINQERKRDASQIDPDALLAFATARSKVDPQNGDFVVQAINTLRTYCAQVPENTQARELLLEMEAPHPVYAPAAIALAGEILKGDPDNLAALKAIVQINVRERKFSEAAAAADHYSDLAPTDLDMQRDEFQIMRSMSRPSAEMHRRADALRAKYPTDPRFLIVKAWAYLYGRDAAQTPDQRRQDYERYQKLILDAALQDPPTSLFAKTTVGILDSLRQFGAGQDLLERAANKFSDPQLTQQLIRRLWENRKYSDILTRLKDFDAASDKTDAELIALKALSQYSLGDNGAADALVGRLAARDPNDRVAYAWAVTLKAEFGTPSESLKVRLAHYQDAHSAQPDNGYISFLLGVSYAQMDENELALQAWRESCRDMPSWAEPHVRLALMLVRQGRGASDEATRAAEDARVAGTNANGSMDLAAAIASIRVSYAKLPTTPDATYIQGLLDEVKQIQTQLPNEPETLPIYVQLLAQTGQRAAAIDAINAACKNIGDDGEDLLLSLVQASRTANLGMEESLYATIQKKYGQTPQLAFARAIELLKAGRGPDGLQLLVDARQKNTNADDAAYWARALCQYREASHDAGAQAAWESLGDAYPTDIVVQSTILTNAESAWADRAFIQKTIDRLKSLTGEQAIGWKIAYARWLLSGDVAERDASEAVVLLTGVTTTNPDEYVPRALLATAYDRLKNVSAGLEQWRKAAELAPDSVQAQFDLLQALHAADKRDDAIVVFDRLVTMSDLSPNIAQAAATIMAAEGQIERAQTLLVAHPNPAHQVLHDATLAKVYRLEGRSTDAAAIYFNLASAKQLDLNTIREAADFFGSQHQLPEAHKFLDRLSELSLPPVQRDLVLGGFEEDHGTPLAAEKLYDAAVKEGTDDPAAALRQVEFQIRQRKWDVAQTDLDSASARWPANDSIINLKKAVGSLAHWPHADELGSLIAAISTDPENSAASDTIAVATDPASTPAKVRGLLSKYPDFEPLYELGSRRLLAAGQAAEAASLASKAMGRFPQSIDAARITAEINAAAGKWNDAALAARQWRQRVVDDTRTPDLFIATADLYVDQAHDAVSRLAPYLDDAKAHPEDNLPLLTTYAEAEIRLGNESDAAALLGPLAHDSAKWRIAWLDISPSAFKDGPAAEQWIEQIRPSMDAHSLPEQGKLAQAYLACADRHNYPPDFTRARDTLKPFVEGSQMSASQWLTYASASSGVGDPATAEQAYRHALAVDPDNAIAQNNLADLLRQNGDPASLKEAEGLATRAIADHLTDPDAFDFYDTLARVLLKEGRADDAITTFLKGNAINSTNLDLLIGLASTCASQHRNDDAVRYLFQIDKLIVPDTHLSSDLAAELDGARQAVQKAENKSSVTGTDFAPGAK